MTPPDGMATTITGKPIPGTGGYAGTALMSHDPPGRARFVPIDVQELTSAVSDSQACSESGSTARTPIAADPS